MVRISSVLSKFPAAFRAAAPRELKPLRVFEAVHGNGSGAILPEICGAADLDERRTPQGNFGCIFLKEEPTAGVDGAPATRREMCTNHSRSLIALSLSLLSAGDAALDLYESPRPPATVPDVAVLAVDHFRIRRRKSTPQTLPRDGPRTPSLHARENRVVQGCRETGRPILRARRDRTHFRSRLECSAGGELAAVLEQPRSAFPRSNKRTFREASLKTAWSPRLGGDPIRVYRAGQGRALFADQLEQRLLRVGELGCLLPSACLPSSCRSTFWSISSQHLVGRHLVDLAGVGLVQLLHRVVGGGGVGLDVAAGQGRDVFVGRDRSASWCRCWRR